jgi:hypothetical protein
MSRLTSTDQQLIEALACLVTDEAERTAVWLASIALAERIREETRLQLEWQPIETAPLDPSIWIQGLTTHRIVEPCHYIGHGDYRDRWGRGNVRFQLTHWAPLLKAPGVRG